MQGSETQVVRKINLHPSGQQMLDHLLMAVVGGKGEWPPILVGAGAGIGPRIQQEPDDCGFPLLGSPDQCRVALLVTVVHPTPALNEQPHGFQRANPGREGERSHPLKRRHSPNVDIHSARQHLFHGLSPLDDGEHEPRPIVSVGGCGEKVLQAVILLGIRRGESKGKAGDCPETCPDRRPSKPPEPQ